MKRKNRDFNSIRKEPPNKKLKILENDNNPEKEVNLLKEKFVIESFLLYPSKTTRNSLFDNVSVFWDLNFLYDDDITQDKILRFKNYCERFKRGSQKLEKEDFNLYIDFKKIVDDDHIENPVLKEWKFSTTMSELDGMIQVHDSTSFNQRTRENTTPRENIIVFDLCLWKSNHKPPGLIILVFDAVDEMEIELIRRLVCEQNYVVHIYTPNEDSDFFTVKNWCSIFDFRKLINHLIQI